ncbi:hypothetical protein [Streptomyces olivoreticuli]|uniref:hypothetical protein n=1 Tax=Streptomyces olivoreticuli TaxID=68246 RepID=UPI000E2539A2|nr:hypothetical protein [Streptomyces olivoreticuli]
MSDSDQLGAIAQQLTATLVGIYGGGPESGTSLVFLPGDLPVPAGTVQQGQVNAAQMDAWLRSGFDNPLLIRPGMATLDSVSSRSASDIYAEVVQWAKPLAEMHSDTWERIAGEISAAQAAYGPPGGDKPIVCQPDDWPLPERTEYWTVFDSTSTSAPATTGTEDGQPCPDSVPPGPDSTAADAGGASASGTPDPGATSAPDPGATSDPPKIDAELWQLRGAYLQSALVPMEAVMANVETPAADTSAPANGQPPPSDAPAAPDNAPAVTDLTTSDSAPMSMHLEHTRVTLQRVLAGRSWWNGVFLSDDGWYVPGLARGTLVPPPPADTNAMAPDLGLQIYVVPAALVVVRNLSVVANWSADAESALSSSTGAIGPLSLAGAQVSAAADGTKAYTHEGMQVVAALCTPLPVLPPADPPAPHS